MTKHIVRIVYFSIGIVSLILGIIGAFTPVLPTVPFVLLSAWMFNRSSKRFHYLLLENKYFGKHIKEFEKTKAVRKKTKVVAITSLWVSIFISIFLVKGSLLFNIGMLLTALLVSLYLIFILKTLKSATIENR
ncbi:MAG: YbaN family protein [Paludibacter sp.]